MAVEGEEQIRRGLRRALKETPDALAAALMREGYALVQQAIPLTPVEGGTLRRSYYVAPPTGLKNPVVEVGVGTKYALYVHERDPHVPFVSERQRRFFFAAIAPFLKPRGAKVGGPKYLKIPFDKRRSGYLRRIQRWTKEFVAKGIGVRAIPKEQPTKPRPDKK